MPRATQVEPRCNLTLTRTQWSLLIALLERKGTPLAAEVVQVIRAELRDEPDAGRVSIDRECQKWIGVVQMVFNAMVKAPGGSELYNAMREQTQAAERTQPW